MIAYYLILFCRELPDQGLRSPSDIHVPEPLVPEHLRLWLRWLDGRSLQFFQVKGVCVACPFIIRRVDLYEAKFS